MIRVHLFQYLIISIKQFDLIGATTVRKKKLKHIYPRMISEYILIQRSNVNMSLMNTKQVLILLSNIDSHF